MMKHLIAAALILAATIVSAEEPVFPDVLRLGPPHAPDVVWVSERAAINDDGELQYEYFREGDASRLRGALEVNADNTCKTFFTQPALEFGPSDRSFDDVVKNSRIIVSGTVVGSTQGFLRGLPGTLVALRVQERLKAIVPVSGEDTLFVFLPQAEIQTRSGALCSTMSRKLPAVPRQGDRLVAFVFGAPNDEQNRILVVDVARHLLLETGETKKLAANALAESVGRDQTLQEVTGRIRQHEFCSHNAWSRE